MEEIWEGSIETLYFDWITFITMFLRDCKSTSSGHCGQLGRPQVFETEIDFFPSVIKASSQFMPVYHGSRCMNVVQGHGRKVWIPSTSRASLCTCDTVHPTLPRPENDS